MTKEELIKEYSHNFRETEMSEEYLKGMLEDFIEDLQECVIEDEDVGDPERER
jgi:nucleoid DNA-binding protein